MKKMIATCLLAAALIGDAQAYPSEYSCKYEGGQFSIDSSNKHFTINGQVFNIDGFADSNNGKLFTSIYTKPIMLENKNVRYMWAINKEQDTYLVIVSADNFNTLKMIRANCDPQKSLDEKENKPETKIANIMKITFASDGYINKEMHDEFWDELKKIGSKEKIDLVVSTLKSQLSFNHEYQQAFWESAKITYQSGKIVKTAKLLEVEKNLLHKYKESIPFSINSNDYFTILDAYNRTRVQIENHSEQLLNGAATHKKISIDEGLEVLISEDLINTVLANLDSSFMRAEQLLTESWPPIKSNSELTRESILAHTNKMMDLAVQNEAEQARARPYYPDGSLSSPELHEIEGKHSIFGQL